MAKNMDYTIQMLDGTTRQVTGLVINRRWGIDKRTTTTIMTNKDGEERTLSSSDFYLSYLPTGMLITSGRTQRVLKELVNRPDMIDEDDPFRIAEAVIDFWNKRGWKG